MTESIDNQTAENVFDSVDVYNDQAKIVDEFVEKTGLKEINPNFDENDINSPYCNNCGSCALATYQRINGLNTDAVASADNIGYVADMEALTGMKQVPMTPEDIERNLLEQGDGANAIIGIDRVTGSGHWFNAVNIGGKVYAVDAQDGTMRPWPPDYGDVRNWDMSVKPDNSVRNSISNQSQYLADGQMTVSDAAVNDSGNRQIQ